MPLSDFQKKKLEKMFSVLDTNGDGRVEKTDFTRRAEAFARARGWSEDSPEYYEQIEFTLEEWHNLRESADTDDDRHVSLAEFLRYCELFLDDVDAVQAYARGDASLIFKAMDGDRDGKISAAEYRAYLDIYGLDPSCAEYFFASADLNEDGRLTRAELARAIEEFLLSEDPESPGNFLYGPLEE